MQISCLLSVMAVAALVAFLMAAVETFTVMMAVVIAFGVGIILQCPFGQRLRGRVCRACHAAV